MVSSNGNQIDDCIISKNKIGIVIDNSNNNIISKNNISLNSYYGLFCDHSNYNIISNNSFFSNIISGIKMNGSSSNRIISNSYNSFDTLSDPEINMVSHWEMDESSWTGISGEVLDSFGSNNGTSDGASISDEAMVGDHCGSFDGTDDDIIIPYSASLEINSDLSITAWVNWDGSDDSDTIICNRGHFWVWISYDRTIRYATGDSPWGYFTESSSTIPVGKWVHVAITRTGDGSASNSVKIYINGKYDNQSDNDINVPNSLNTPTYVGKWGYSISGSSDENHFFKGRIDDMRIYNDVL